MATRRKIFQIEKFHFERKVHISLNVKTNDQFNVGTLLTIIETSIGEIKVQAVYPRYAVAAGKGTKVQPGDYLRKPVDLVSYSEDKIKRVKEIIEKKDLAQFKQLIMPSRALAQSLERLFEQYSVIRLSLEKTTKNEKDAVITTLVFSHLVDRDGQTVIPGETWKRIVLEITKEGIRSRRMLGITG